MRVFPSLTRRVSKSVQLLRYHAGLPPLCLGDQRPVRCQPGVDSHNPLEHLSNGLIHHILTAVLRPVLLETVMLNRVLFCLIAIVGALAESGASTFVQPRLPHVYPDGFVERSLAIVIRDGRAYGEYSIGLNESTAGRVLELARENLAKAQRQAKPDSNSPVAKPAHNADSGPNGEQSAAPGVANEPSEPADPQADTSSCEGEHLTDPDIIQQYPPPVKWFILLSSLVDS